MGSENDQELGDTAEFPAVDVEHTAAAGTGRVRVDCAALTHPGHVRANNEDHHLVARFGRFLTPLLSNVSGLVGTIYEDEGHALVVADGLGGSAAGEVASDHAIRSLLSLVLQTADWIISPNESEAERVMRRMTDRFLRIDEQLVQDASKNEDLRGMATTMTLACNVGESLILAHVGDSRAYLFRAQTLKQLTHDHTVAQGLVDHGILQRTEEASRRLQHTLTRFLGGIGQQCSAEVHHLSLQHDDVIVLCSDGLSDMVDDPSIATILAASTSAADACQNLLNAALQNGGRDNVTVIVARYGFFN